MTEFKEKLIQHLKEKNFEAAADDTYELKQTKQVQTIIINGRPAGESVEFIYRVMFEGDGAIDEKPFQMLSYRVLVNGNLQSETFNATNETDSGFNEFTQILQNMLS